MRLFWMLLGSQRSWCRGGKERINELFIMRELHLLNRGLFFESKTSLAPGDLFDLFSKFSRGAFLFVFATSHSTCGGSQEIGVVGHRSKKKIARTMITSAPVPEIE